MTAQGKGGWTPGPWEVRDDGVVGHRNSHAYLQPIKLISPWIEGAWEGDEEAIANGRIAAAAPTLLEALEEARDHLLVILDRGHGNDLTRARVKQADAAISLARGEPKTGEPS